MTRLFTNLFLFGSLIIGSVSSFTPEVRRKSNVAHSVVASKPLQHICVSSTSLASLSPFISAVGHVMGGVTGTPIVISATKPSSWYRKIGKLRPPCSDYVVFYKNISNFGIMKRSPVMDASWSHFRTGMDHTLCQYGRRFRKGTASDVVDVATHYLVDNSLRAEFIMGICFLRHETASRRLMDQLCPDSYSREYDCHVRENRPNFEFSFGALLNLAFVRDSFECIHMQKKSYSEGI